MTKSDRKYSAPAAACAADVLLTLARTPAPLTASEIADLTSCTRSLVYRVLGELQSRGFAVRCNTDGYAIGAAALELSNTFVHYTPILASIRRHMAELAATTGETVNFGLLRGTGVLYMMREEGPNSIFALSSTGRLLPANALALGKAALAELSDDEIVSLYNGAEADGKPEFTRLTRNTLVETDGLLAALRAIRRDGYACEFEEAILGRGCIAIALPLPIQALEHAGISISMPIEKLRSQRSQLKSRLKHLASEIVNEATDRAAYRAVFNDLDAIDDISVSDTQ